MLLQHAAEVNSTAPAPSSSSNPLFGLRDLSRPRRESGHSPQHNVNSVTALDHIAKGEAISMSSHLILKDPLEEPHVCYWTFYLASLFSVFPFSFFLFVDVCFFKILKIFQLAYIEERGKLNIMKEFDETTIWTSDRIPLMASYNTGFLDVYITDSNLISPLLYVVLCLYNVVTFYAGRMQHSVWVAETSNSNHEMASTSLLDAVPPGVLAKQFSLRRIWQGKGAHTAACKVPLFCYYFILIFGLVPYLSKCEFPFSSDFNCKMYSRFF